MWVYHDLFFATRIQINVIWNGSGPGQIIRIQPDPKHWFKECTSNKGTVFMNWLHVIVDVYLNTKIVDYFDCY